MLKINRTPLYLQNYNRTGDIYIGIGDNYVKHKAKDSDNIDRKLGGNIIVS